MLLMECRLYVPLFAGCVDGGGGGRKFKLSVLRKNCDPKRHAVQSTSGCSSLELHVHTGNISQADWCKIAHLMIKR